MSYVYVTVRVDIADHTFVSTPHQAQIMVEHMLQRDPRWSLYDMMVEPQGNRVEEFWTQPAQEGYDRMRNVFENPPE